jgi:hypothetical protein
MYSKNVQEEEEGVTRARMHSVPTCRQPLLFVVDGGFDPGSVGAGSIACWGHHCSIACAERKPESKPGPV